MPTYFLNSSALVKAYRQESGTQRVVDLLAGADPLAIARLAHVEVSSALVRRGRAAGITPQTLNAALDELDHEIASVFHVVEFSAAIIGRAVSLTRLHALRAADALQLACALHARELKPQEQFTVVSSDQELHAAAAEEGFSVIDPVGP